MILGLGSDICDIRRIEAAIARHGDRFITRVFTEVERAKGILAAMAEAEASGAGAVTYKGGLVDRASVRQAEVIVAKMRQIERN